MSRVDDGATVAAVTAGAGGELLRGPMLNDYCKRALDYLSLAYDRRQVLFSYSTSMDGRGAVVNDFRPRASLRYTINTYLGLTEAERHGGPIDWLGDIGDRVGEFLALHEQDLTSPADHGLLLVLLAAIDPAHAAVARSLRRLERILASDQAVRQLNMQDLGWMLWGTSSWAGDARGAALAERVFGRIRAHYVHPASGLPRHSLARYRPHTVSFGSVVYFLRSVQEYAEAVGSTEARELFAAGVERVLAFQCCDGAWPWMIDVRSGWPFDLYPIFTVHQDSMAMLFLLPAERYGISGASAAIERSLRWNFGYNELGARMVMTEPYPWIYRSIERSERCPRTRRFLRGLGPADRGYPRRSPDIRINRECRSYHLGWVLYAWSDPARVIPLDASCSGT